MASSEFHKATAEGLIREYNARATTRAACRPLELLALAQVHATLANAPDGYEDED